MKIKNFIILIIFLLIQTKLFSQQNDDKIILKASESKATTEYKPNNNGVYPVILEININDTSNIKILEIYKDDKKINTISNINQKKIIYADKDENSIAGIKYTYQILAKDINNKTIYSSKKVSGWGALTHERFYVYFNQTIQKAYKRLTLMNKKNNLQKLGKEEIKGLTSGTLLYQTNVKGFSGIVTLKFTDFSDSDLLKLNGSIITNANMNSNGTMTGTINVSGMYNGKVYFDKAIILKGKAGDGFYGVEPEGFPYKDISYQWIYKEVDD